MIVPGKDRIHAPGEAGLLRTDAWCGGDGETDREAETASGHHWVLQFNPSTMPPAISVVGGEMARKRVEIDGLTQYR
jgi:hypothetical protein